LANKFARFGLVSPQEQTRKGEVLLKKGDASKHAKRQRKVEKKEKHKKIAKKTSKTKEKKKEASICSTLPRLSVRVLAVERAYCVSLPV
jgi:hypothetical protein